MTPSFYRMTWSRALQDNSIQTLPDPVSFACIDKASFHEAYHSFMDTLDGRDLMSFVDFFFCRSPLNKTQLEFVDNDARLDFFEFLCDDDLIPSYKLIATGDWCRKKQPKEDE